MMKKVIVLVLAAVLLSGCTFPGFATKKAGLQVSTSTGEKASVFVDGISVGQTPLKSEDLKPGSRTIKLVPEDTSKASYETTVSLTGGNISVVNWTFGKTLEESGGEIFELSKGSNRNKSELSIVTNPDNIIVKVDGQSKGFSPLVLDDLVEGSHSLTMTAPGFIERTTNPKLVKGYRLTVTTKLAREVMKQGVEEATPEPTPALTPSPSPKASVKPTQKPIAPPTASGSSSIKTTTKPPLPYVEVKETGTGWLRVRADANGTSEELAKLDVGSLVPYLNQATNGWLKIEYQTGKQGWVSGQYAVVHKE
ncbi:MAG: PEGA domain-containing protein [Candidatus Pacebacteria bacterium]|nr:PEGA domain-containing protein [Candidatus Paceibacterota bacterium]